MKTRSFCKRIASVKDNLLFAMKIGLALYLTVPAIVAFSVFMGGGNIKEK